jgi:hypothetical protein
LLGDAEWRRFERQICLQPGPPTPLRLHPKRRTCVSFVLRRSATPGSRADGGSRETPDARAPDRRPSSA